MTLTHAAIPAWLIPKTAAVEWRLEAPRFLYADFKAGTPAGALVLAVDGHEALRLPLYTETGVKKAKKPSLWRRIKAAFAR